MRGFRFGRLVFAVMLAIPLTVVAGTSGALGYATSSDYAATDFATGFPFQEYGLGPMGLAFDPNGNLYVIDFVTEILYKFGPAGGTASSATAVGPVYPYVFGLAFGADGNLYGSSLDGHVYQINTATGMVVRSIVNLGTTVLGLALDPISGDLFAASLLGIVRISNYQAGPGTVTLYTPSLTDVDGINFGPDGTLYVADRWSQRPIAIAGTNTANPGAILQVYPVVPGIDGIGVAIPNPSSSSGFLLVNSNYGFVTKIDISTTPATTENIFTGGSRGDFTATGPDGCLYVTQTDRIVKITNADGTCSFFPPDTFLSSGSFVLGDGTASMGFNTGAEVTWWGSQWSRDNVLSIGAAPAAFKGFADTTNSTPPACGGTWTARTGNSSHPPTTVPTVMAVIVASTVVQKGSTISGTIDAIVLVKTNSGYGPSPGHRGTGTVVGVLCPTQ